MKGFRILLAAGAIFALTSTSAHATAAAVEAVSGLGKALAGGSVAEVTALAELTKAGFSATEAAAVLATLNKNKAKLTGVDWSAFEAAAKTLSTAAISSLVAKLETATDGTAFIADLGTAQVSTTVAPAGVDYERIFLTHVPTRAKVADVFKGYKTDKSSTARQARTIGGKALYVFSNSFPQTCAVANQAACKVTGVKAAENWIVAGYPKRGPKAERFFINEVGTSFNKTFPGEQIGAGAEKMTAQGDAMSKPGQVCFSGEPLTSNN